MPSFGEAWYANGVEHRVDGPALTGIEVPLWPAYWPAYWPADHPAASPYRVHGHAIRSDCFAAVLDVHDTHPIGLEALWDLVLDLPAAVRDDPVALRDVLHESLG